jgi:ankyrin repeat protein
MNIIKKLLGLFTAVRAVSHKPMTQDDKDLIQAAKDGNLSEVKRLLDKGTEIDARTDSGATALMWACVAGDREITKMREIAKMLITKGADVNARDAYGGSALTDAIYWGSLGIAQLLLDNGTDVNVKREGITALMWAIQRGYQQTTQALIDKGAEIDARDDGGETALIWASYFGRLAVVQALLAKGAKVNAKSKKGITALILASQKGHRDVGELLIKAGAK